jgi:hypothetical protein
MARRIPLVILAYMLWLASAALSLWAGLWLRTVVLIDLPIMMLRSCPKITSEFEPLFTREKYEVISIQLLRLNRWALIAVDKFGTVVLGLVWLLFVLASEADFRKLPERRRPAAYVAKVFAVEAFVLGAAYAGHLLMS